MKHHILVADDSSEAFFILNEVIDCETCILHHVMNGNELIQFLEESPYKIDLIISDYHMPNMSIEKVLQILRTSEKFEHIPFYIISGCLAPSEFEVLRRFNLNGVYETPIGLDEMAGLLKKILKETGIK